MDKPLNHLLMALGSIFVALSGTVVGINMFKNGIIEVFIGYLVFVLGYKTCWYGANIEFGDGYSFDLSNSLSKLDEIKGVEAWKFILVFTGVYLVAHGTIEFGMLVAEPEPVIGAEAGISTFLGYVIAHEGVNRVPL